MAITAVILGVSALAVVFLRSDDGPNPSERMGFPTFPTYPRDAIVCEGSVSPQCASTAAMRIQKPVAWLENPGAFNSEVLAEVRGEVTHALKSQARLIHLYSNPASHAVGGREAYLAGASRRISIRKWGDAAVETRVTWEHDGASFLLSVVTVSGEGAAPRDVEVERLLIGLRYAQPSGS